MIIKAKIDVTKIIKDRMFHSTKSNAVYLDVTLLENRNGVDKYGNSGMVVQDLGKEARKSGENGPILGNFKVVCGATKQKVKEEADEPPKADDVPF